MEKGKRICQTLKELRKRIADANDIPYEIDECSHKGDCAGTCPKCEQDIQYLSEAIEHREQSGKPINLKGLMSDNELRKAYSHNQSNIKDIESNLEKTLATGLIGPDEQSGEDGCCLLNLILLLIIGLFAAIVIFAILY